MRFLMLVDVPVLEEDRTPDTRGAIEDALYSVETENALAEIVNVQAVIAGDDLSVWAVIPTRKRKLP